MFVLPTLAEGCCNAIIEALACGLPIISSDLDFNYDILDESCAILVEPNDVEGIKKAILRVKNEIGLRRTLQRESIRLSTRLDLKNRCLDILNWMESRQNHVVA